MKRTIIKIDQDKCDGCGLCVQACHEGAIEIRDGKAVLIRDDYCDGLGNCLPVCPAGALSFEEREALPFDAQAVAANTGHKNNAVGINDKKSAPGCPGMRAAALKQNESAPVNGGSQLNQWPVQIKLAPENAAYFDGAHLLLAADCTAYAYANFHNEFMKGKVTLIGCPKLDGVDYAEKLTRILALNNIMDVTVLRMEVPCCAGLADAARRAVEACGKPIPLEIVTITLDGEIAK